MNLRDREISAFVRKLNSSLVNYKELLLAIRNSHNRRVLESMLVEQFSLSVTIQWEAFINDLIIAYILMSPAQSLLDIKTRMFQSITEKFGAEVKKCLKFNNPTGLDKTKVASLHDQKGWNITADNANQLSQMANRLLTSKYARRFSLTEEDSEFFNYLIDLRNYLSHYSLSSKKKLKATIESINSPENNFLTGRFIEVGSYLKRENVAGASRAELIINRLIGLIQKL